MNIKPDKIPVSERTQLFNVATKVLELDSLGYTDPFLRRFQWHVRHYFQWHCLIYVLNELRYHTVGPEADHGWKVVGDIYKHHVELAPGTSRRALFIAVGNLTLKAWNAHERMHDQGRRTRK